MFSVRDPPAKKHIKTDSALSSSNKYILIYYTFCCAVSLIIIWQDSLEVNPSVLIGSFLVGILPYGPFPWKRSYAVYFCSRKLENSNYEKKTFKYSHLRKKLPKKIDILQSLQ